MLNIQPNNDDEITLRSRNGEYKVSWGKLKELIREDIKINLIKPEAVIEKEEEGGENKNTFLNKIINYLN